MIFFARDGFHYGFSPVYFIYKEKRRVKITHPAFLLPKNRLKPGQNYNFGRPPTQAKNPKHTVSTGFFAFLRRTFSL
jgi:hypothetical protein